MISTFVLLLWIPAKAQLLMLGDNDPEVKIAKFENAALPAGYKPPKVPIVESHLDASEDESNILVVTTIPPRIVGQPPDPDGNTEWIVLGETKMRLLGDPAQLPFQPVPKPSNGDGAYIIQYTPTMGKGMFATRDIKMGEIVFAALPLPIAPSDFFPPSSVMEKRAVELRNFSPDEKRDVYLFERELQLEVAVGRMDPGRRENLLALASASVYISIVVWPGKPAVTLLGPDKSALDETFDFQKAVINEGLHTQRNYWEHFVLALIVACRLANMNRELITNMRKMREYSMYSSARKDLKNWKEVK